MNRNNWKVGDKVKAMSRDLQGHLTLKIGTIKEILPADMYWVNWNGKETIISGQKLIRIWGVDWNE